MRVWTVLSVLLLSVAQTVHADPPVEPQAPAAPPAPKPAPPPTPEQAADAVLAAIKSKDDGALKALASKDDPDPWLVADELIRRGEFDAADGIARAAPRVDVEKLPAYAKSRRAKPDDRAARVGLAAARSAFDAGRPQEALDALGPPGPEPTDVVGIRRAIGRGVILDALRRVEESTTSLLAAADAAERVGWLARAAITLNEVATRADRRSDFRRALSVWQRCLSIAEARGLRADVASAIDSIGNEHRELGDHPKALDHLERALRLRQELGDRAAVAGSLVNIGNVHASLSDYPRALGFYEQGLREAEAVGQKLWAANALNNIGNVHDALGELKKAITHWERSVTLRGELGDGPGAAKTLRSLGTAHASLGSYPNALECHERAQMLHEEAGDSAGVAGDLVNVGNVEQALGNFSRALEHQERALTIMETLRDHSGAADVLGNIGNIHGAIGNYPRALEFQERALKRKEDLGDRAGAAGVLGNIGTVYDAMGDYPKALEHLERALTVLEDVGDRADVAGTLVNIGNVYSALGNYPRALSLYERGLREAEAAGHRQWVMNALANIGNVHESLGDYPKALEHMERALTMMEAAGDRAGAATAVGNIGSVYESIGDFPAALQHMERALRLKEEVGDRDGAAATLASIGGLHFQRGAFPKAIELLERAVRAAEKLRANALLASTLQGLAFARLGAGDAGRAIESAHRGVKLLERVVGGLGDEEGATARSKFSRLFSVGLLAAAAAQDAPEAAFFLESGRAGTLLESLGGRDRLRRAALPEGLRVAESEARAGEARALVAYTAALDAGVLDAIRARDLELTAARARLDEVVGRIQREAKQQARLFYPLAAPIEDLQGLVAAGEALVLYGLAKGADSHALVLTREHAKIVRLGTSADIESACEALDASDREADVSSSLARLRELLVTPLALPMETRRLLVSPEGPLSYVPFAALLPGLTVAFEPSGTTYGALSEERATRGEQVLALGDPDYTVAFNPTALDLYVPAARAAVPARGGRLTPLPGTRAEARSIGDVTLFGKDASEAGLRAALAKKRERWHAVHFACHGLVDPERPTLSSLVLTPDAGNDGFLTAREVLAMQIPSDLVVLSACETGKGKIVRGEGIVGLTRAFMFAGSPRVVCSLWKVDDEATRALMLKFYELWNPKDGKPGLPTAEALRKAQEFVRSHEKWKHPYYWAAWVLWGLPS